MTTPRQNTRITAAQWRTRYAEILREYPDNPPELSERHDWNRIRQAEQFTYALNNPPPHRWRVVKAPSDPEFAARAFIAFCVGLPALPICET
jgi:hypothetical protein